MNDWIWLDPQELASAGVLLRDVSQKLIDSTSRTRSACCVTGLGRHAGPLMGEAETVAAQVEKVTEVYLRLAIDILQRAIATIQEQQMASAVGSVGSVSTAIIGGTTVGGLVVGDASPVSTAVIGGTTVGGLVVGDASPVSTAVIGGTTVGGFVIDTGSWLGPMTTTIGGTGYYHGGGSGLGGAAMILAQAADNSMQRQRVLLDRLRNSGGGAGSNDLGTQMLIKMNNDAMLKNISDNEVKMAASQPFAGIVQAEAADKIDFGGRAQKILDDQYYEKKRNGLI